MRIRQITKNHQAHFVRLMLLVLALALAGCSTAPSVPSPTLVVSMPATGTPTTEPTTTVTPTSAPSTATATATRAITPTSVPTSPATARLNVQSTEQTVPAGASASFVVGISGKSTLAAAPSWSVTGLPAGTTRTQLHNASPITTTLVVDTPCTLSPGSYSFDVQGKIPQVTQATKLKLNIGPKLVETTPGTFSGAFSGKTIEVRQGGPSTLRSGPFLVLQFCSSAERRKGVIQVRSATSDAGTPLTEPMQFILFKILTWPVPDFLQTNEAVYANASEVARNSSWKLEWNITPGVYMVAFLRSPFDTGKPANTRAASFNYTFNITR